VGEVVGKNGWPQQRIDERLPSPASKRDAEKARFWADLEQPMDASRLPMAIQTDRPGQARRAGKRILQGAVALALLLWLAYRTVWADAPLEEFLLAVVGLPVLVALLGAAILWAVRGHPDTMRLELSSHRVRYGLPPAQWEEPLSSYAGLALRRHLISDPSRRRSSGFSSGERAAGMHQRVERWWIELVHEDPARTVVLWASDKPLDDGLERVDALAEALDLPVLTTSNRYWVADEDDDAQSRPGGFAGTTPAAPSRAPPAIRPGRQSIGVATRGAKVITPGRRMHAAGSGAAIGRLVPRLMALCVMLPLVGGTGWLTWTVAQETRTVVQTWHPVEVTVLDKSGADTMRLAIVDAGGTRREADVTRTTDLKAFATGESFPAYADPADSDMLRPATGASLWGGVATLAFFTLVFAGIGVFLLRTRPLRP